MDTLPQTTGSEIQWIELNGTFHNLSFFGETRAEYQKEFGYAITNYCKDERFAPTHSPFNFKLVEFDITDEIANLIIPLLDRVRVLQIVDCEHTKLILTNLSAWAPEMRELRFVGSLDWQFDGDRVALFESLRQKFPKLESFSFQANVDVENGVIEEFLKQNSQLKQIKLSYCDNIDEGIFQSIGKYAPRIEKIYFMTRLVSSPEDIRYFSQLRELKSLTLRAYSLDHQYIPLVVHELASAKIPLECLDLSECELRHNDQQFTEDISKIQELKKLRLCRFESFTARHLIEICKHLKELAEIEMFRTDLNMSKDDLLELIQSAGKLIQFTYFRWPGERTIIDGDTFQKLVNILEQRREKIKLNLVLGEDAFTLDIPEELIRDARDLLTMESL